MAADFELKDFQTLYIYGVIEVRKTVNELLGLIRLLAKKLASPAVLKKLAVAALAIGAALAVDLLMDVYLLRTPTDEIGEFDPTSVSLYLMAVMVSALYGGLLSGLAAVAFVNVINLFLSWNSHFALASDIYGTERIVITSFICCGIAWLASRARKSQRDLAKLNRELEERVKLRTAALEESKRQLESFCYSLAHDLRAPLRAMQGFSLSLLEDHSNQLDKTGKEYAQRILTSSQAMGELMADLLSYTQLDRSEIHLEEVSLQKAVEKAVNVQLPEIQSKHAEVVIAEPLPPVRAHLATLELVIVNLLSNALKFSTKRPRVRFWPEERPDSVRLWVADNGIGIDPAYQNRIFGVFERLHTSNADSGTGIGLALSKKGIERMGGQIGVQSEPGQGSRFWIELPKCLVQPAGA